MDPDSDPDPDANADPAIFVIDLQRCRQQICKKKFSASYFLKVHLHHFSKIKSPKDVTNSRNQGFSFYFCLMIEGSGSGSIPLINESGSGSRRPKNKQIRRIRIRNTGSSNLSTSASNSLAMEEEVRKKKKYGTIYDTVLCLTILMTPQLGANAARSSLSVSIMRSLSELF